MITSLANEQIKAIRKLRDRKFRDETGLFFIEGTRIVFEALDQNKEIQKIIYSQSLIRSDTANRLVVNAKNKGIEILEVSEEVFHSISHKEGAQGISAVMKQHWSDVRKLSEYFSGLWIALNEIADPGNLGTIIRTADAVGAAGIILIGNCTDPYDPTALRANMGGLFSIDLVKMDLDSFVELVENNKIEVIGTSDSADQNYRSVKYPKDMVLLMGSERQGIDPTLVSICRSIVKIPMMGKCDSLNLAIATGIILYEIFNQHQS